MTSGPITSRRIDGETLETVTDFIFLGFKITADGYWSHKIKDACSLEEKLLQTYTVYLKQRYYFVKIHVDVWQNQYNIVK